MRRPSSPELYAEMAGLSAAYGWSLDTVLDLEHRDRRAFLAQAAALAVAAAPPADVAEPA
ncbi:MAG TPA: hypothetical protein VGW10_13110 [Solirubrobacteraceae bacterium]|nr:hypothetical protein [Solirubrobacteraceae bacterium]